MKHDSCACKLIVALWHDALVIAAAGYDAAADLASIERSCRTGIAVSAAGEAPCTSSLALLSSAQIVCNTHVRSSQLWKRSAVALSALTSGCAVSVSKKIPPWATTATCVGLALGLERGWGDEHTLCTATAHVRTQSIKMGRAEQGELRSQSGPPLRQRSQTPTFTPTSLVCSRTLALPNQLYSGVRV